MDDDSEQFWKDIDELISQENVAITTITTTLTTAIITTTTTTTTTTKASISNPLSANVDRSSNHNLTEVRQIAKYLQYGDDFNSFAYGPHFLNDEREEKEKRAGEEGQQEEKTQERNASEQ